MRFTSFFQMALTGNRSLRTLRTGYAFSRVKITRENGAFRNKPNLIKHNQK
jgi:hypothetical protein